MVATLMVMAHGFARAFVEGEFELRGRLVESLNAGGKLHQVLSGRGLVVTGARFYCDCEAEVLSLAVADESGRPKQLVAARLLFDIGVYPDFAVVGQVSDCGTHLFRVERYQRSNAHTFSRFLFVYD